MLGANPNEDLFYSILGNLNDQVDELCKSLKQNANLTGGFNAIGLSQVMKDSIILSYLKGGLLLRAYIERCNDPKVLTLITLGTPHQGVANFPGCTSVNGTLLLATNQRNLLIDLPIPPNPNISQIPDLGSLLRVGCPLWKEYLRTAIYAAPLQEQLTFAQYFKARLSLLHLMLF